MLKQLKYLGKIQRAGLGNFKRAPTPLRLKDIWAIRFHLQQDKRIRDLALFNLAIDSKLRGCDLVDSEIE